MDITRRSLLKLLLAVVAFPKELLNLLDRSTCDGFRGEDFPSGYSVPPEMEFVRVDRNGFTINHNTVSSYPEKVYYVAIPEGVEEWGIGSFPAPDFTGELRVEGVGFEPSIVSIWSGEE